MTRSQATLTHFRHLAMAGVALLCCSLPAQIAEAQSASEDASLLAGLRPAEGADLQGLDLSRVGESQELRQTIRGVIELLSGRPVKGHDTLRTALSPDYLVSQFDCRDNRRCLARLFRPLAQRGFATVIIGAYFVGDENLTLRLDVLNLKTGVIETSRTATVPKEAIRKSDSWVEPLGPLFTNVGQIALRTNVTEFECLVDGEACVLDEGQEITLSPGEHVIQLSKEGFVSTTSTVTVEKGETKPLALALNPLPTLSDYLVAGQIDVAELLKRDKSISLNGRSFIKYGIDESNVNEGGTLTSPFFALSFSSKTGAISFALDYNFYAVEDWLRFAWIGYKISETMSARFGVIPVDPALRFFGAWPEESMGYHMGIDDDHDSGVDWKYEGKRVGLQVAYLLNDEFGGGARILRYTGDITDTNGQSLDERHQGVLRATYKFGGDTNNLQLGATGSAGLIRNNTIDAYGTRWSAAAHAVAKLSGLTAKAQAIQYAFAPKLGLDDMGMPLDTTTISMGYFGKVYDVAARGTWAETAFLYDTKFKRDPLTKLRFHAGTSNLFKKGGLPTSTQFSLGGRVDFSNLLVFITGQASKNAPQRGDGGTNGLAGGVGGGNAEWFFSANLILLYTFEL